MSSHIFLNPMGKSWRRIRLQLSILIFGLFEYELDYVTLCSSLRCSGSRIATRMDFGPVMMSQWKLNKKALFLHCHLSHNSRVQEVLDVVIDLKVKGR
jgi:hypothetical protein